MLVSQRLFLVPKFDPFFGRVTSPGKRPSRASWDGCRAAPSSVGGSGARDCQPILIDQKAEWPDVGKGWNVARAAEI